MELLDAEITAAEADACLDTLRRCQNASGGFGGGPGQVLGQALRFSICSFARKQMSHLAPTYAAVNALAILAREDAYAIIDRYGMNAKKKSRVCCSAPLVPTHGVYSAALVHWMRTLRTPGGGFVMQHDGEIDVRGAYCAVNTAILLQLPLDTLFEGTPVWIAR